MHAMLHMWDPRCRSVLIMVSAANGAARISLPCAADEIQPIWRGRNATFGVNCILHANVGYICRKILETRCRQDTAAARPLGHGHTPWVTGLAPGTASHKPGKLVAGSRRQIKPGRTLGNARRAGCQTRLLSPPFPYTLSGPASRQQMGG